MNKQQEKEFSAKNILDEWNSVTGLLTNNSSYYFEVMSLIEDGYKAALAKCEEREKKLVELVKMVQDNTKMPHQHTDYYTRLCCLSERSTETLKELGYES